MKTDKKNKNQNAFDKRCSQGPCRYANGGIGMRSGVADNDTCLLREMGAFGTDTRRLRSFA